MQDQKAPVESYVVRLNGRIWGFSLGVLFGVGLFLATNILLLKGGSDMGQHLGLLSNYFPGYSITFLGSLIGFAYAFVVGYAVGRLLCLTYNFAARGS